MREEGRRMIESDEIIIDDNFGFIVGSTETI